VPETSPRVAAGLVIAPADQPPSGWPENGLDLRALYETGWRPVPFREFVLKMHGRCDLACSYCYVFQMADSSWQQKPAVISPAVISQAASRIGSYASRHGLHSVRVVLHGGEPLLAGVDRISRTAAALRKCLPPGTQLDLRMQTNGVRLSGPVLQRLLDEQIAISVSLDGDRGTHDRQRRDRRGQGSFDRVAVALRQLTAAPFRPLFAGLLCTIDVTSDPVRTYQALREFEPPVVDFLLPHGNWTSPPPGRAVHSPATPYADWLIAAFEQWYREPAQPTRVRLFDEIITLLLGGRGQLETIGLSPVALLVIDTDGSLEQVDSLKSAFDGAAATGLNVFEHDLDEAMRSPAIAARQIGLAALADQCRACPVVRVCGGGYYPHRFQAGRGFRQPSVYCPDLLQLIRHIDRRLAVDLSQRVAAQS
jgi:uncharacterized protein